MVSKGGVLVVDKPRGPTSHDVVARVRRALGTRAVGHAGTLDPMATGVLVVAVGEATKLVAFLSSEDKEYDATIALGRATDTLDAEGRETERADVPASWQAGLDDALQSERARVMQLPPVYSAIHAKGARSHELARRGEAVELAERPVAVRVLEGSGLGEAEIRLRVTVSKSYYVRSLARDLAARLGTVGHLAALRRVRAGAFSLSEAVALDSLREDAALLPVALAAARVLPVCTLSDAGVVHARAGRRVPLEDLSTGAPGEHAWLASGGDLVAIGRVEDGAGRVTRGFG